MEDKMIKVGITHGDINGIGYEVILKTVSDVRMEELCTPVIYGSSKIAAYHRKALDLQPINLNVISSAEDAVDGRINIINCVSDDTKVELSQSTEEAGKASLAALEAAVALDGIPAQVLPLVIHPGLKPDIHQVTVLRSRSPTYKKQQNHRNRRLFDTHTQLCGSNFR